MADVEMVERVARAICEHALDAPDWDALEPGVKGAYVNHARAAIEALREPTAAMVALAQTPSAWSSFEAFWRAMIDAILKEEGNG